MTNLDAAVILTATAMACGTALRVASMLRPHHELGDAETVHGQASVWADVPTQEMNIFDELGAQ